MAQVKVICSLEDRNVDRYVQILPPVTCVASKNNETLLGVGGSAISAELISERKKKGK